MKTKKICEKNVLTWKGYQDYRDFTPIEIPTRKAISKQVDEMYNYGFPKDWGKIKVDGKLVDFTTMLEVPTPKELGMHRGNDKMSLANKITLILTVVNVIILISLVIKNV